MQVFCKDYILSMILMFCFERHPLLGSKNLGFYVFRTLICIVGKPQSKQCV